MANTRPEPLPNSEPTAPPTTAPATVPCCCFVSQPARSNAIANSGAVAIR